MKKIYLMKTLLLLFALVAGSGSVWAENVTVSMTSFTEISGNVDGDANISYEAAKGTASTAPAVNNGEIRVYQNGGTFTVTANNDVKIKSITLGSSMGTTVTYSIDGGTASSDQSITANGGITVGNLDCSSVLFTCTGTTKSTRLYVNSLSVTYSSSGSSNPTCVTPTFSPEAGVVISGTTVSISSSEGATIYYTTNGTTPTTSSSVYSDPIEITANTTIKAFATKSGFDDSEVAEATYTVKQAVSGYDIDFESDIDTYVDWIFSNVGNTNTAIDAYNGEKYGANINESGNAVQTASIQTNTAVAYPDVFTCYVSKASGNTTSSTWYIQVSSDGSTWENVKTQSATSMLQGTWIEFTANLSSYNNVFVRLYYNGSNAVRAVDDILLTERDPNAKVTPTIVIDATALTTDLAGEANVNAGTATAAVMNGQTAVENVSVTWSSSNTDVATINETTGAVTLIATGTTTLTATFAGNDDYNEATGTYILTVIDSQGPGSENNPFTVAEAIAAVTNNTYDPNQTYYISGIVSSFYGESISIVGDGSNYRYYISDDGTTTTQLLVYKGKGLNQAAFANADDLLVGDEIVIVGKLMVYNNAPEVASGNYLKSLNRKEVKYYLAGSWGENDFGWGEGKEQLTKNGDTYTITKNLANGTLFKIVKVDEKNNNTTTWYGGPADGEWFGVNSTVWEDLTLSSSGKNFKIEGTCDETFTFTVDATDPDALKLTVTGWHIPVVKYYLAGNWGTNESGWTTDKIELSENADGTFSTSKLVGNGTRFKFVKTVDGTENWLSANKTGDDYGIHSGHCTGIQLVDNSNNSAFTIQIAADATLSFKLDATSMTFDVAGWPIEVDGNMFVKVTTNDDLTDGAYLIVYEKGNLAFDGSANSAKGISNGAHIDVTISKNAIAADATTKGSLFYIQNGSIKSASGFYIGRTSDSNGLDADDETVYTNTISIDAEGNAVILSSGGAYLRYNTSSDMFRYYKSSTYTGQNAIQLYKLVTVETVAITSAGMATYYSENPLDFTGFEDMWAYTAAVTSDGAITYTRINKVPARTAVVLYNPNGGAASNNVPVCTETPETVDTNNLIGVLEYYKVPETATNGATNYLLNNGNNGVGFYKANGEYGVAAHRAYLQVPAGTPGTLVRSFYGFNEGGVSTGIEELNSESMTNNRYYNLNGQQTVAPQKGLYIVNGKKVMVK